MSRLSLLKTKMALRCAQGSAFFYGIIIILSILVLGKVADFGWFNSWDDNLHVAQNYWITNVPLGESLQYFWTNIHKGLFMPLTYTAWKLVWTAVEPLSLAQKASVFHILCLLFHTINACLIFKIFTKLNFAKTASLFAALIFLLHPVQVESFAWISEFKGIFAFFWCAISVIQFLNYRSEELEVRSEKLKYISYSLSILFYIFALLCKPSAVPLPFVFAFLLFFKKDFSLLTCKKLLPFFALAFIFALITRFSQPSSLSYYLDLPFYTPVLISLHTLGFYLVQLIIPFPLVSIYPDQLPADVVANIGTQLYWLLGLLALVLPIRYKIFRWIWLFALLLLPNSGIVPFDYQRFSVVADRYQYLPMPVAIFGFLLVWGNLTLRKNIAISVIIIIFAIMTFIRTDAWRNAGTLHYSALKYNTKTAAIYVNLSEFLINTGQFEILENLFALADSNNIKYDLFEINRAVYFEATNQKDSAVATYRRIISGFLNEEGQININKSRSDLIHATMNYGRLKHSMQNYSEAILSYNVAKQFATGDIGEAGKHIEVLNLLAAAHIARAQDGDLDTALIFLEEAKEIASERERTQIDEVIEKYINKKDKNDTDRTNN